MKGFYDEPTNTEGANQIVDNDDGQGNKAKAWLHTKDNTSTRSISLWAVVGDAVLWAAGGGILARSAILIDTLIKRGLLLETPMVLGLLLFVFVSIFLAYRTYTRSKPDFYYRVCLFTFGILLAVL